MSPLSSRICSWKNQVGSIQRPAPLGQMGVPGLTRRQTVSKPRFWSILALQAIDFARPHFRKSDF
jgi:hypothetical protein